MRLLLMQLTIITSKNILRSILKGHRSVEQAVLEEFPLSCLAPGMLLV